MNEDILIDKDRAYCSQNYIPLRLKCPFCILERKYIKHCKNFKNLSGLWYHIKTEHDNTITREFSTNQIKHVLNHITKAIEFGIIPTQNNDNATTTSLKLKSKGIRVDVQENLERIVELLLLQSELYPNFKIHMLEKMIIAIIGERDKRTVRKYLKRIIDLSEKDKIKGMINVTKFCDKFMTQKLNN